jgi:hypothetical protein
MSRAPWLTIQDIINRPSPPSRYAALPLNMGLGVDKVRGEVSVILWYPDGYTTYMDALLHVADISRRLTSSDSEMS